MNKRHYLGALDIGSQYTTFLLGEIEHNRLNLVGHARVPSKGIVKSQIEDTKAITQTLGDLFESLTQKYSVLPEVLCVSQSGSHLRHMRYETTLQMKGFQHNIDASDVEEVNRLALAKVLPSDDVFLHHSRLFYSINNTVVDSPLGHMASQLSVCYNALFGNAQRIKDHLYAVNQFGFRVKNLIFSGIASALATTTAVEREQGICVINIGEQVTEFVVYKHQIPTIMGVLPVGGKNFTRDLCSGLRIHENDAERLKFEYGIPAQELDKKETDVWVVGNHSIGDKKVKLKNFRTIMQARAQEMFDYICKSIKSEMEEVPLLSGIVLTGGGALLKNIENTAAQSFQTDCFVRGSLADVDDALKSPMYTTCFGLLYYALQQPKEEQPKETLWQKFTAWFGKK